METLSKDIINVANENVKVFKDTLSKSDGSWHFQRDFKAFGHAFHINIDFCNGDPLGFIDTKSLSVFSKVNDEWNELVDCTQVGVAYNNDYYGSEQEHIEYAKTLIKAFYEQVEFLYGD